MRILVGSKVCNVALGWRLITAAPRVAVGVIGIVRPETVLAPLPLEAWEVVPLPSDDPAEEWVGRVGIKEGFLG